LIPLSYGSDGLPRTAAGLARDPWQVVSSTQHTAADIPREVEILAQSIPAADAGASSGAEGTDQKDNNATVAAAMNLLNRSPFAEHFDDIGIPQASGIDGRDLFCPPTMGGETAGSSASLGETEPFPTSTRSPASKSFSNQQDASLSPNILVQVQAMDSQSFMDHSHDIALAVRQAMLNMNTLNDVILDL
jgi:hypothetical protein